jgi:uracil-DNA glycosylase
MISMVDAPRMNRDPEFLADKKRRLFDPRVAGPNRLVEHWSAEGRPAPWVDPDSGGMCSRILFLAESPGPAAALEYGSGIISPDNDDPTAERFWRLSHQAGLTRDSYLNWNVVPWYVSPTGKNANATDEDGKKAQPYLHDFVSLLPGLRVVVLLGRFAQQWWLDYLDQPESPVLPVILAPHPAPGVRRRRPNFEQEILQAMVKAGRAAG